ncbi:MAG: prolipoprotein diacylglyceryl transferase [Deltaproteobacteria bacterium]|nr:prolipoprotein diacylglyceryl transferase [Deltaproteobacteria bacterium]
MAQYIIDMVTGYWFWGMTGFLFGGALCVRNMLKNGCSFPLAVIALTIGLYAGLLGTRALYVLIFYPQLFLDNPVTALAFWQGTGTWLGGPFFGAIGAMIVLKAAQKPIWSNLGSIAPGLAMGHAIGRIGCLFVGCCYGAPTSVPWAIYSEKLNRMVHPTPIYSMIGELISLAILQGLWRKPERRPYLPAVYGMLLAVHRFISESFRGVDAGPEIIPGLRVYQTLCVFIFAFSLFVFVILKWKKWGLIPAVGIALLVGALTVTFEPTNLEPLSNGNDEAGLYLVITRSLFSETLDRWAAERRKNGFDVLIRPWKRAPSTRDIRAWIGQQVDKSGGHCRYILIVGDCGADEEKWDEWHIPAVKHVFQVNQEAHEFVTDAVYGDLDRDGNPDVPVGRLAVRSTSQLKAQIQKILTYQYQELSPGWFRAIIWTGAKGYTSEIHQITSALTERLPKWVDPFIIDGDPRSEYSGYLPEQPRVFLEQISQSPFFTFIASHGSFRSVNIASYRGKEIFLSVEDLDQMKSRNPSGVMFLLGCDSGKFNTPWSLGLSLSEAFADHPGGPIGVVAATAATNPLTNYFFAKAMIDQLGHRNGTIGAFMLRVQRMLYQKGKRSLAEMAQDDRFAKQLIKAVPDNERKVLLTPEHLRQEVLMYNLLGDPACKLKLPQ